MRDTDLFQQAPTSLTEGALVPPWLVTASRFEATARRLDIDMAFPKGTRFACFCGRADCPVHDTEAKTWRHLDFFQHQAFLHARVPRVRCPPCQ